MDNEQLTKVLTGVMAPFGYEIVNAEFTPFRDVKVTWERSYKQINMKVTDYLQSAPESVIESMLSVIVNRMLADKIQDYPQDVIDYFMSPEFSKTNVTTYLNRAWIPQDHVVKTIDGYTFILNDGQDMPTNTISPLMRVIGIRPEYINDPDIEHIGIHAVENKNATFGRFKGVIA